MPWQSGLENHPDYVRAIGMISIENGNLEYALADLFSAITFTPKWVARSIYFTPKSGMARVDILKNSAVAAVHKNKPERTRMLNKIARIAERSFAIMGKRNGVIHDQWFSVEGTVIRVPLDGVRHLEKEETLENLSQMIETYRRLINDVYELRDEFKANPPALISMRSSAASS